MAKLAGLLSRRRWFVVAAWLIALVLSAPLAARQTEELTGGGFDVPGSESKAVEDASAKFQQSDLGRIGLVLEPEPGMTQAQASAAVKRASEEVAAADGARVPERIAAEAETTLAAGEVAVVPIAAKGSADELIDTSTDLRESLSPGEAVDGVTAYVVGQPAMWSALTEVSEEDLQKAEAIGFPIVALILIAVFGSLAAATLPLALGLVAVTVTGAEIYLLSQQIDMSVFVTNMASMIGIGVAVDYSLFILARFRESVRAGRSSEEARAEALSTSGLAVVFSGAAVIISLAGLWMVENQALRSMALGAMIVVAVAILVATTLLPALIRILGHRVEAGGIAWRVFRSFRQLWRKRRRPGSTSPDRETFWQTWTARVMRRPVISAGAAAAVLLVMAIPVLDIETGDGALQQFEEDHDARVGTELAAAASGGGADPVRVLTTFEDGTASSPANAKALKDFSRRAQTDPQVESVTPPIQEGQRALVEVRTKAESADADQSLALVGRMRDQIVPASSLDEIAAVEVGGEAARIQDSRDQIDGAMWRIILFVLAFSFVVLMLMLRSLVLPLKAVLMNLLSIGAAYGVLVVTFQWGWFEWLGFEQQGSLNTLTPPLVLAVVFGLSMDYEVLLLSRIKEHYEEHGDNRRAVAEGLSSSAGVITSAALIMVAVFTTFALTGVPSIQQLGLGNAVAIAVDATIVRLVLVPAFMELMGDWNWWLPGWLDRLLPHVGLEGQAERSPGRSLPERRAQPEAT